MIEFFLPLVVAICLFVSFSDFRYVRIPNYAVLALLLLGIVFQFLSGPPLVAFAYSVLYGLFSCLLLWFVGIWPAGDAKLFWALMFFFPPAYYLSHDLAMDLLFNSFVPIFLFMFFVILYRSKMDVLKEAIAYSLDPYKITMIAVILSGFVWFVSQIIALAGIPENYFVYIIILFAAFELLQKFFTFKTELAFLGFAVLRMVLDFKNVYTLSFVYDFALLMGIFVFFRFFILYLAFKVYTKEVKIEDLEPGVTLAEGIKKDGKEFKKADILEMSLVGFFFKRKEKYIHGLLELSEKDVKKIKKLKEKKKLEFDSVLVNQTQPFAFFIFCGYLLTLFCRGIFLKALM